MAEAQVKKVWDHEQEIWVVSILGKKIEFESYSDALRWCHALKLKVIEATSGAV